MSENNFEAMASNMKHVADVFGVLAEVCAASEGRPTVEQLVAEARRQALEEAAKVAESLPVELPLMPGMADGASMATNQIARAIRDMKDRT